MSRYLEAAKRQIDLHGSTCSYIQTVEGTYDVNTSSITNTENTYSVKMYKKHLRTDQYNFPDLIGRQAAIFYLTNYGLSFVPKMADLVLFDSERFSIQSIQEHRAAGQVILYKLVAVKG
jgi:hypothetical protein